MHFLVKHHEVEVKEGADVTILFQEKPTVLKIIHLVLREQAK